MRSHVHTGQTSAADKRTTFGPSAKQLPLDASCGDPFGLWFESAPLPFTSSCLPLRSITPCTIYLAGFNNTFDLSKAQSKAKRPERQTFIYLPDQNIPSQQKLTKNRIRGGEQEAARDVRCETLAMCFARFNTRPHSLHTCVYVWHLSSNV